MNYINSHSQIILAVENCVSQAVHHVISCDEINKRNTSPTCNCSIRTYYPVNETIGNSYNPILGNNQSSIGLDKVVLICKDTKNVTEIFNRLKEIAIPIVELNIFIFPGSKQPRKYIVNRYCGKVVAEQFIIKCNYYQLNFKFFQLFT